MELTTILVHAYYDILVTIYLLDYWDTVEDEHTIWSDVASFSLRQHTTKIFYVYPLDLNILSANHPGLIYVKN